MFSTNDSERSENFIERIRIEPTVSPSKKLSLSTVCQTSYSGNIDACEWDDDCEKLLPTEPSTRMLTTGHHCFHESSSDLVANGPGNVDRRLTYISIPEQCVEKGISTDKDNKSNGQWSCNINKVYSKNLVAGKIMDMTIHNESMHDINDRKRMRSQTEMDCSPGTNEPSSKKMKIRDSEEIFGRKRMFIPDDLSYVSSKKVKTDTMNDTSTDTPLGKRQLEEGDVTENIKKPKMMDIIENDKNFAEEKIKGLLNIGNDVNDYLFYRFLDQCVKVGSDEAEDSEYGEVLDEEQLHLLYDEIDLFEMD